MKKFFSIILFLAVVACEKVNIEHNNDFDKSYQAWLSFKKASDNSYSYSTMAGSWSGASWSTELVVSKGLITERRFKYTSFGSVRKPDGGWNAESREQVLANLNISAAKFKETHGKTIEEVLEWSETGATLGTHTQTSAAELLTLDQVYKKAETDWLVKRSEATIYFEAKNNGLISTCGYVMDNCADDCFNGISVSEIKQL